MPQPLSKVRPNCEIDISTGAINRRPDFAFPILRVIAFWSSIDGSLAMILSRMLKTDIATGTAMYEALSGGEAKRQVLLAAADQALAEWANVLLRAVLSASKASRNQRNDFAHHIWAVAEELPDAILLMNPSVVIRHNISHRQVHDVDGATVIKPEPFDYSKIMVYRGADFERAVKEAANTELDFIYLYDAISRHPALGYGAGRRLLLSRPRIQQEIAKMTTESGRPVPPELLPEANVDPLAKAPESPQQLDQ